MIDWDRVQELRDEIGAEAFGEVVELFLEEVTTKSTSSARSRIAAILKVSFIF
jgi:hypothetical protein